MSEDGTQYLQRGRKQLQYGALIGGRAIMVTDSAVWLKVLLLATHWCFLVLLHLLATHSLLYYL